MSKKSIEIDIKETLKKEIASPNTTNEKYIILFGERKLLKPIKELFKSNENDDRWYVFSHNTLFILDDKSSLECVGGYYNLECSFGDEDIASVVVEKKEPIDPITVNIEINSFNLSSIYKNILILKNSKVNVQYIDVIGYNNIKDSNLIINDLTIKNSNINKSVLKVETNCNIVENLLENVDINVKSFSSIKSNLNNGYLSGNNCTLRNSSIHNNEYSKFYITNCKDIEITNTTLNHHQYVNPTSTRLFKDSNTDYKGTAYDVLITSWFDTGYFNGLSSVPFVRTGKASLGIGRFNIHIDDFTTYYNGVRNKIVDTLPKNNPLIGNISPIPYSCNNQYGLIPFIKPLDEKVISFGEEQLVRLATANRYSKLDYNDTLLLRIYLSFIDQIASRLSLFPLLDNPLKK